MLVWSFGSVYAVRGLYRATSGRGRVLWRTAQVLCCLGLLGLATAAGADVIIGDPDQARCALCATLEPYSFWWFFNACFAC